MYKLKNKVRATWKQVGTVFIGLSLMLGYVPLPKAAAAACPCSMWPASAAPSTVNTNDAQAVELGVKFTSDVAGSISGIRFYKGSKNTGIHTGSLWTANGTRLAKATFANETASGWQQVTFASPVTIAANTTYIASYYTPKGYYSSNYDYFNTPRDNAPLHMPSSSTSGGNGVYKYGSGGGFPNQTYRSSNYWVDVVFNSTPVTDTTPPTVSNVTPAHNASDAPATISLSATFSEAMNASTITNNSFDLKDGGGQSVPFATSYDASSYTASLKPNSELTAGSTYTASVKTTVKDGAGNTLSAAYNWSFTVANGATPPEQGPGGPILAINASGNPFSKYYSEILRSEGLNSFTAADISTVTAQGLQQYQVVILGEMPLTTAQVTMFSDWVNSGGNLIAMRPDKKLAGLLGLSDQASTLGDGYMLANTSSAPGAGVVNETMQFHGTADRYTANSGTAVAATLYANSTTATSNPAVTIRNVGGAGGQAVAFTYDLARSIIYSRQGNPAWAGDERDGSSPIRPNDLFYGAKAGDNQPDYVDLNKVAIPQADEQQRLLANLVQHVNQDKNPLPKFWYFPKGNKAVLVMAGDDHSTANGTKTSFDSLAAASPANCSVANWECHRATSWLYLNTPVTDAQAASYQQNGFDIGAHVSSGCSNWTAASLQDNYATDLANWREKYPSLPNQAGSRLHCIVWTDWATQPKVELANGIRFDMNYYYWPGSWVQNRRHHDRCLSASFSSS